MEYDGFVICDACDLHQMNTSSHVYKDCVTNIVFVQILIG